MLKPICRFYGHLRLRLSQAKACARLACALTPLLVSASGWAATDLSFVSPPTPAIVRTPQVHAELIAHAPQGVQSGQALWVGLQLTHQPGWHSYWLNPGDSGLPTQLELHLPAGISAGDLQWPLPRKLKAGHLTNYGFENTALLAVPLTVSKRFKPSTTQSLTLQLHANWLVCRLECIPQEGDFSLDIPTHSSFVPQAAAFEALFAQQPQTLKAVKATSRFDADQLVIQVHGLPQHLQGHALGVYPETAELVASATDQHTAAKQSWQGDVWTLHLPLSPLRVTSPKHFDMLLTVDEANPREGYRVSSPITEAWPALPDASAPQTNAAISSATQEISPTSGWSFALAVLGAFVGGLILNLMPCVLPILAIKLLGFTQQSRPQGLQRVAGLAYTAGVVLSFLALGAGILGLRAAGEQYGWGFQLQSPAVVSVLATLFTLIALNLFGLFEFGQILPSRLAALQSQHPAMDALLSGVLAVAVASPCTAPFMGVSLGLAMTLPTWQALLIFATMGMGLATPYFLASWIPAVAKTLPRPGPWMISLRQLLGFPMLATVVWLLWVLGQQTSLDAAMLALANLVLLAAFVWVLTLHSLAARGLACLLSLLIAWGTWTLVQEVKNQTATPSITNTQGLPLPRNTDWQPWSEAAVAQSLSQARPVFIDFTAAWCVTCQINKKTTLSRPEVLSDFASHQVTLLRADWTRHDPAITAALTALGRSGVPVYVLHAPGQPPVVLSELLSTGQIRDALATLK